eukprot:3720870-Pyramimonas_sp.AAC.1
MSSGVPRCSLKLWVPWSVGGDVWRLCPASGTHGAARGPAQLEACRVVEGSGLSAPPSFGDRRSNG